MRVNRAARVWVAAVICAAAAACSKAPLSYPEQIAAWHGEKDQFMRRSSESPVPPAQRDSFPPLAYFPVDGGYRVPAMLQVAPSGPSVEMPTSTGQVRKMRRVG